MQTSRTLGLTFLQLRLQQKESRAVSLKVVRNLSFASMGVRLGLGLGLGLDVCIYIHIILLVRACIFR